MTLRSTSLLLLTALAITGCKHEAAPKSVETVQSSPAAPAVDPATAGTITGVVRFNGKAPERVPIDMSMDPACAFSKDPNLTEQFVIASGKLANVFIYVKSGITPSQAPAGAAPVVLDQKGCRYLPHVVAVQQGGSVQFRNSDPTMHNIHTMPSTESNEGVDISQGPMGQAQTHQFKSPETMLPVRCNNHPWMNAFVNVAPNPYFAVSGADGSFTIQGLPPGNYTLAAVHEKLGEQDIQITVAPKATANASFAFTGK